MDQFASMIDALHSMLGAGERDMLTRERWQAPPLTAAQRELEHAMSTGGVDEMQAVLEANPGMDVNFHTDGGGLTLLHMAALTDQPRIAALLLDGGADVDLCAPTTREPPLVTAACYGRVDVIRVLLERGANPHLADWSGATAASRLESCLQVGPEFAEGLRLVQEAASATSPLSRAAKREGGCGGCGRTEGVKLSVCSRCSLRSYCSRECQKRDFPQHKQREQLALLADTSANVEARRGVMKRLEHDAPACQMAQDLKGVKLLLEALPSDRAHTLRCLGPVQEETRLLTLCALRSIIVEREGPMPLPPHAKVMYAARDALQQFAAARGMEVVLQRLLAPDCPPGERIQGIRLVSSLFQGIQEPVGATAGLCRSIVRKGQAEAVVRLLARLMREHEGVNALFTNSCVCLAGLALQEGPSFQELSRQASSGSSGTSSGSTTGSGGSSSSGGSGAAGGQQEQLWPVARWIFELVDLHAVARRLYSANNGVSPAATELLAVLSRSRPAFERLVADPLICSGMVGAFYADLFMTSPVAYGLALEFWDVVHRYRPGLLLEHWKEVQGVLAEVCGHEAAGESPWFVRTVLDPIDAQQPVERSQQGSFASSRHALKAARLLAHIMAAPRLPSSLLGQLVEMAPDLAAAVQACKDPEAAAVLHKALTDHMLRIEAQLMAAVQQRKKKTVRR